MSQQLAVALQQQVAQQQGVSCMHSCINLKMHMAASTAVLKQQTNTALDI
jgi:hypothetical protein